MDLINRQAAIEVIRHAIRQLNKLPTAEPEIIRCKDCKHYASEVGDESFALGWCPFIKSHLVMSKGFCAWGVRRKNG